MSKKIESMLEQMVEELVRARLQALAEKKADEMLKALEETQEAPTKKIRKSTTRKEFKIIAPTTSILSLSKDAPATVATKDCKAQVVWEKTFMMLAGNPTQRHYLQKKLADDVTDDIRPNCISSMISQWISAGYLHIEA